jgi:hypothetical protein
MNTKFVLASFVAALSGFAGLANTAKAGTDLRINLNLGLPRPPVVVVAGPSHSVPAYGYSRPDYREPRGYWKEVTVKTWVPASWVVSCDRRGREIRTMTPGYFTYRTDRVWVDGRNDYGYSHR